jgi:hypothetical protein
MLKLVCWLCCCLLFAGMSAGCNQGPPAAKRAKLEGTVTLNGQPVANGQIRFMAIDPNGMNVVADIKDGHYLLTENQGPTKGKYQVQFSVPSAQKKKVPNDDVPGEFREEAAETIPEKYRRDSKLIRDIAGDKAEVFDFQLTVP